MKLSKAATIVFNLHKDSVPSQYHGTLEMGCWYYGEWLRVASAGIDVSQTDERGIERGTAESRYMKECKDSWLAISDRFGLHPYGQKKLGAVEKKSAKTSTKGVPLRKI